MRTKPALDWESVALWAPVVGVAAVSQTGLGLESPWTGSDAALALTTVSLAAPLLVRRRRPLVTAALLSAALWTQVTLGGSLHFGSFVAILVGAYAGGRWSPSRRRAALVVLALFAGAAATATRALPFAVEELVFPLFYITASACVGAVIRRLAEQSAELTRRGQALARQVELTERLAVATERNRIARDLHDTLAHGLTVTVVQAEAAEQSLGESSPEVRRALQRIQETSRQGLAELRGTLRVLRADDVPRPGVGELRVLAAVHAEGGLRVDLDLPPEASSGVDQPVGGEIYRVVQESLTNVLRHSAATIAEVSVRVGDAVEVVVSDPGPRTRPSAQGRGFGLAGMAERLAPYGGVVSGGPDGEGWTVRAHVPREMP